MRRAVDASWQGRHRESAGGIAPPPPPPPAHGELEAAPTDPIDGGATDYPAPRSGWKRRGILVGAALIALIAAVIVASGASGSSDKRTARIVYTLTDTEDILDPSVDGSDALDCHGTGGYADFEPGVGVRITDAEGTTIGSGTMRNGDSREELIEYMVGGGVADDATEADDLVDLFEESGAGCMLIAEVKVKDSEFFELHLGNSRGSLTYSREELAGKDWYFTPTLG